MRCSVCEVHVVYAKMLLGTRKNLYEDFLFLKPCHSNLDLDNSKILTFHSFYKQLFLNWQKFLSSPADIPSSILSRSNRSNNKNIKINSILGMIEILNSKPISYIIFSTLKKSLKYAMT